MTIRRQWTHYPLIGRPSERSRILKPGFSEAIVRSNIELEEHRGVDRVALVYTVLPAIKDLPSGVLIESHPSTPEGYRRQPQVFRGEKAVNHDLYDVGFDGEEFWLSSLGYIIPGDTPVPGESIKLRYVYDKGEPTLPPQARR